MQKMCAVMIAVLSWIIYYVCCTIFFQTRFKSSVNKVFYVAYVSGVMLIVEFLNNNIVTTLFEILMPLIFFKGHMIKKEVIYWLYIIAIFVVAAFLNIGISVMVGVSNPEIREEMIPDRMLFVLSLVICYYLVSFIKIKVTNKFSQIRTPLLFHFSVVLILLMAIICFLVQIYQYELAKEILSGIENTICAIFMLVIVIDMMSFEIIKKSIFQTREYMEEKAKLEVYEMQRKYDALATEQLMKLSALRHDFKNHLYVVEERIRRKENDEAVEYIHKIKGYTEEAENIVVTENEILATILTVKNAACRNKNVKLDYEISCGKIYIEDIDLNVVVANLLDNAIEAVEKCREGNRNIAFKIKSIKQFLAIECSNTCEDAVVIQEDTIRTTKKDKENHGFGVHNIKETVLKYGGKTEFTSENGIFYAKILMENNEIESRISP